MELNNSDNFSHQESTDKALINYLGRIKTYSTDYLHYLKLLKDNPEICREIIHSILFKKEQDRDIFLNEIEQEGFITISTFNQSHKFYPYSTEILKSDKTHPSNISKFTYFIGKFAFKHNGIYESWETIAISDEGELKGFYKKN